MLIDVAFTAPTTLTAAALTSVELAEKFTVVNDAALIVLETNKPVEFAKAIDARLAEVTAYNVAVLIWFTTLRALAFTTLELAEKFVVVYDVAFTKPVTKKLPPIEPLPLTFNVFPKVAAPVTPIVFEKVAVFVTTNVLPNVAAPVTFMVFENVAIPVVEIVLLNVADPVITIVLLKFAVFVTANVLPNVAAPVTFRVLLNVAAPVCADVPETLKFATLTRFENDAELPLRTLPMVKLLFTMLVPIVL